jgi:pimeloyl-ACP methyl ester carboxylesterase
MDLILIPGFWLDGHSWDEVATPLKDAGHNVHALTLPGLEARHADRGGISLRDHVEAVVSVIDSVKAPVVLVGHSGGGAIAHAAADARPDAVARVIYVDSGPLGDGDVINDQLPEENGEVLLPDWSLFENDDLIDLDDTLREKFRAMAIPEPARVTRDKQQLSDSRRYDVPVTVICCEFSADSLQKWMAAGEPYFAELAQVKNVTLVDLPTGHWPQLTKPQELATAILEAVKATVSAPERRPGGSSERGEG